MFKHIISEYYNVFQTFIGNSDSDTIVKYQLQPFVARFVKLIPKSWNGWICLRWELYGCPILGNDLCANDCFKMCNKNTSVKVLVK